MPADVNEPIRPPTADDRTPESVASTIAFVDLIQFTSLTNVHGDEAGADAADTLESLTRGVLGDEVRLVKTAGDGVLLQATNPHDALRCIAALIEQLHDAGFDARAGADHGSVVARNGDVFGSTVNLAARLASLADPGSVVMTRPVALAATDLELAATALGPVEVRGFDAAIELFQVDPCHHHDHWLVDPVCGMRLEPGRAASPGPGDPRVGFCSPRCAELFEQSPERYRRVLD